MSRRAYIKHKRAMKRRIRKTLSLVLMVLVIATILIVSTQNHSVAANDQPAAVKYYTHVVVEEGDTMWSIADRFYSSEYEDYDAYIDEVRSINHLETNRIFTGHTLVVPYYRTME